MGRLSKIWIASVVVIIALLFASSELRQTRVPQDYSAVVQVKSSGCHQAPTLSVGTVVQESLVVTVAHAIAGQDDFEIQTSDGTVFPATVESIDPNADLAILRVSNLNILPVRLADAMAGSKATMVAFESGVQIMRPAVIRKLLTINTEDIYRQRRHPRAGLEVAVPVNVGNSGSPLMDGRARMVGMIWGTSIKTSGRSWATPANAIRDFLAVGAAGNNLNDLACAG